MMPGGGAQYAGMGRELYERRAGLPGRRSTTAPTSSTRRRRRRPARGAVPRRRSGRRRRRASSAPSVALPALFATEYAMGRLLESWGITPAAMIGHSAGEYVAACLSGVVSMEDGLRARRPARPPVRDAAEGRDAQRARCPRTSCAPCCPTGLSIAAVNAPDLCVASGPVALVEELEATLAAARRRLHPRSTSTSPPTRRCSSRSSPSSAPSAGRSRSPRRPSRTCPT